MRAHATLVGIVRGWVTGRRARSGPSRASRRWWSARPAAPSPTRLRPRASDRSGRRAVGRRGQGQDRRPARPGVGRRLPLPGRPERRAHDRRRRRDVEAPPDAERRRLGHGLRDRRRLRRRPAGVPRRDRRARGARHRPVDRRPVRQRAPDHALARGDRPGVGAAARQAADRDDQARASGPAYADKASRIGIRVQDVLDPKILRAEDRGRARREEPLARAHLRGRAVRPRGGRGALRGVRAAAAPYVGDVSLLVDEALRAGKRRAVRRRAGDDARPRPRHVSVRHVVEPDRLGRRDGHRHRADADRPRARRLEGVRDARRRGAVPVGDRRAGPGARCASSAASSARSRAASAAAAGSTSSRSATRCA